MTLQLKALMYVLFTGYYLKLRFTIDLNMMQKKSLYTLRKLASYKLDLVSRLLNSRKLTYGIKPYNYNQQTCLVLCLALSVYTLQTTELVNAQDLASFSATN